VRPAGRAFAFENDPIGVQLLRGTHTKVIFGDSLNKFLVAPKIFALISCFHLCGIKNKLSSETFVSCTSSFFLLPVLMI
jgi:hypothetical protein